MALRTRPQHFSVFCDIDTKQIMRTSKMVAMYTGIAVQPNKARHASTCHHSSTSHHSSTRRHPSTCHQAIVGANAFAHESGIHQHGMLKHAATYEIMTPESVGADRTFARASGRVK